MHYKVKDGKIEVLTEPRIRCCPLRRDLYGIEKESRESVERVLQGHMLELGMYDSQRFLQLQEKPVSFGASEILMDAMAEGSSARVHAGTVVTERPDVQQAIGAHMTGLIETEPIAEIQNGLEERGCFLLNPQATIDQVRGYEKAVAAGFQKIAVTVAGTRTNAHEARALRELGTKLGYRPFLLAVHTTVISEAEASVLADNCDLVWSCTSRAVREVVGYEPGCRWASPFPSLP